MTKQKLIKELSRLRVETGLAVSTSVIVAPTGAGFCEKRRC